MFLKLTTGVDFTIILQAAFARSGLNSAKSYQKLNCIFALLGSW